MQQEKKPPFRQVSFGRIVSTWRILDIDPDDFRRRFQLCPPQILNPTTAGDTHPQFWQHLENLEKSDFLKSRFMKSRGVKCHPWWLLMPSQGSLSVLVHFHEHWCLMISGGFLVFSQVSKCPSVHVPKFPSVQVSKSHPWWFPGASASLPTCSGSFSRTLIFISGGFLLFSCEESASHPLFSARWVPQVDS